MLYLFQSPDMALFSRSSPAEYAFTMRDNVALQFMQSLVTAGRATASCAILAVEAYDLADAFITQVIHEKRDGK